MAYTLFFVEMILADDDDALGQGWRTFEHERGIFYEKKRNDDFHVPSKKSLLIYS